MTFKLMEDIKSKVYRELNMNLEYYAHNANEMPKRHFYNRFVKDLQQWALKYIDFMHFTVGINYNSSGVFKFPGEYVG